MGISLFPVFTTQCPTMAAIGWKCEGESNIKTWINLALPSFQVNLLPAVLPSSPNLQSVSSTAFNASASSDAMFSQLYSTRDLNGIIVFCHSQIHRQPLFPWMFEWWVSPLFRHPRGGTVCRHRKTQPRWYARPNMCLSALNNI